MTMSARPFEPTQPPDEGGLHALGFAATAHGSGHVAHFAEAPTADVEIDFDLDFDGVVPGGLDLDLDLDIPASAAPAVALPGPVGVGLTRAHGQAAMIRTQPMARTQSIARQGRRVLVVSADADERAYVRSRMALARLVFVDEARTTTQAMSAMDDWKHALVFINLDTAGIDGWMLARHFRQTYPGVRIVASSATLPAHSHWWNLSDRHHCREWQRKATEVGIDVLLPKPMSGRRLAELALAVAPPEAA